MVIGIDFDGTCVAGYPRFKDVGAAPVLRELVNKGWTLVLNTCRTGVELEEAVKWFQDKNLPLMGINHRPGQERYASTKVVAELYIDDRSLGAPLVRTQWGICIDWKTVAKSLLDKPVFNSIVERIENERGIVQPVIRRF